jgi:excisionase family DNA binding protein
MSAFEKMFSVKEAAGLLGVSRDSVVRLIDGGYLEAVRFPRMGGRGFNRPTRIEEAELKRFIERNKKKR